MKTCKFRAWDKVNKEFLKETEFWIDPKGIIFLDQGYNMPSGLDSNNFELIQYTGLKDSTGKEIFQGDIIMCKPKEWRVEFESIKKVIFDSGSFGVEWEIAGKIELLRLPYLNVEVIGTAYENPELLESKQ